MRLRSQPVVRSDRRSPGRRRGLLALVLSAVLSLSIVSGAVGGVPKAIAVMTVGLFSRQAEPDIAYLNDSRSMEVGLKFSSSRGGRVIALQFYRSEKQTGSYIGTLWSADGDRLGTAEFGASDEVGWQTASLTSSVRLDPHETYTVSYFAEDGYPAATRDFFTEGYSRFCLEVPVNGGVSKISSKSAMPTKSYRGTNYMVDVVFVPADDDDTDPGPAPTPTPTTASPTPIPTRTTATPTPTPTTATPTPTRTTTSPTPTPTTATPTPSPTTASPTATTTPTALPSSGTGVLDLPREAWWGGPSYYAKFSKAAASGWSDPSFFPIAVFLGKPEDAASLRSIGINTYMGAEHDGSRISTITSAGISVLAQDEWTTAEIGNDSRVVGWHLSDECEMGYSGCPEEEYASLAQQQRYASTARARNDGRFLQANFGNGVLGTYWATHTMDDQVGLVDVSSVDKYAYTSPHVQGLLSSNPYWPAGKKTASSGAYGWLQDRMETYTTPARSKPNWVFVETAMPLLTDAGATTISAAQLEGAAWNSIIHGASGIAYFQHNNNGICGNYSLMTCASARAAVAKVNGQIQQMAPVINTQSYVWTFGTGLETSLKVYQGNAYVFAMTDGGTGSRTFRLPAGVEGTTVEVVGESRSLTVTNGTFTDSFATESTHHTYRITI